MSGARKVNEAERNVVFKDGSGIKLTNVTEVDNSGSYLRLTAAEGYFLINPDDVRFHQIVNPEEKVF